ncbi:MAG: NrfD/PsrC family molybdoenzyme membrane anchor subunit [Bryobacteraceae bacterium]
MPETRYKHSVEPVITDGRDIDPSSASLVGEAASQQSSGSADIHVEQFLADGETPRELDSNDPTYYGRPMLQRPVWEIDIPIYYYVGGLTGASLALAAAVQLNRSESADRLVRRAHIVGIVGASISGILLVHDLGRPSRFLNMLRVFRPTSPMNVGAWILASVAPLAMGSLVFRGRHGMLGTLGEALGVAAGISGLGLATYTGVLVSNSAIPVWQASRHLLPILFGASAIASAGGMFALFPHDPAQCFAVRFGMIGQAAELVVSHAMERQVSKVPAVGRPLKKGRSGVLWKAAVVFTTAGLVINLLPGQSRAKRIAAGIFANLGSFSMRMAIHKAGEASALDARASFHQQRAASD